MLLFLQVAVCVYYLYCVFVFFSINFIAVSVRCGKNAYNLV